MSKNYVIYDTDQQRLDRYAEEYLWLGRDVDQEPGKLTVLAMPRTWKRKQEKERRLKRRREQSSPHQDYDGAV